MPQTSTSFRDAGRTFQLYYLALVGLNAALLTIALRHLHLTSWPLVILWIAFYTLALALRIPTDRGAYFMVSAALDYAGLIILGAPTVALVNLGTTLVYETVIRRPLRQAIFNASLYSLMVLLAGDVYRLLGGQIGSVTLSGAIVPLIGAGLTYLLVNKVAVSFVISLYEHIPPRRVWQMNYRRGWTFSAVSLSMGLLIAYVYQSSHLLGVSLAVLPVILFWYYFQLYSEVRRDLRSFVIALTSIIEEVDPYTRNHSLRVSRYATRLARGMRMSERDVETIEFAGLLHDLGKVGADLRGILQKSSSLTAEERRVMASHPGTGADIVHSVRMLRGAADLVRSHHERLDGKGYPRGLKGDEVPVGARILLVADTFDAMTSDRPYRAALSAERALTELRKFAGSQFDPVVVEILGSLYAAGEFGVLYRAANEEQPEADLQVASGTS